LRKANRLFRMMAALAVPCVLLMGCAGTTYSSRAGDAALEEVRAFEARVMGSYNSGDAAKAASHYATDAFVFVPGQTPAKGRVAIATNIARYMEDPNFRLSYANRSIDVSASSDLAYTRGELAVTFTDTKAKSARTMKSHYLLVMRRQRTSEWEVVEDISF
jgi:uncharacterized protein (TIGR02246 family)